MAARLLIALAAAALAGPGSLAAIAGKSLFERNWISSPASLRTASGLGPHYDARSCAACHAAAGPGAVSEAALGAGMVVRLGDALGRPDPAYGAQLTGKATPGTAPEAQSRLTWTHPDGLRRAEVTSSDFSSGALTPGMREGLRRAPSLRGLAALADVPDAEILAQADEEGMRGRPSWLTDTKGRRRLGRFGWKATQADLDGQVALSMVRDLGVSTPDQPDAVREALVAYVASLPSPPAPSTTAPGYPIFQAVGCGACHADLRSHQGVKIGAYTDLLLHDMGRGLDDGVGEGAVKSPMWRTAPLWTIAEELVRGGLLHDGRARNVAEAVRWHGGEAAGARARFEALSAADRNAVVSFLGEK